MRAAILAAFVAATPALAAGWTPLEGDAIRAALTGRVLDYGSAWQDFRASGRTLYNAGADSWGTWTVQGDRYCSQWPPNAAWACYDVDISSDGEAIRFRGAGEDVSVGSYRKQP
jgi:hypothetical protein